MKSVPATPQGSTGQLRLENVVVRLPSCLVEMC